jgi:hypothetical protein
VSDVAEALANPVPHARRVIAGRVADPTAKEVTPAELEALRPILDALDLTPRPSALVPGMKRCKRCTEAKPLTEFAKDGKRRRGSCRDCENAARRTPGSPPRKDRPLEPCGTPAAGRRHYRHGEKPCPDCAGALARDATERRARRALAA